jgi:hypothetical protein
MTVTDLPAGYRITEAGVPDAPTQYQVLRGSGREQQVVGVRTDRAEATQLAFHHASRSQAEWAAGTRRAPAAPCAPRR